MSEQGTDRENPHIGAQVDIPQNEIVQATSLETELAGSGDKPMLDTSQLDRDTELRTRMQRSSEHLSMVAGELDATAAQDAAAADVAALAQIKADEDRQLALIAIGQMADAQPKYKEALEWQAAQLAEEAVRAAQDHSEKHVVQVHLGSPDEEAEAAIRGRATLVRQADGDWSPRGWIEPIISEDLKDLKSIKDPGLLASAAIVMSSNLRNAEYRQGLLSQDAEAVTAIDLLAGQAEARENAAFAAAEGAIAKADLAEKGWRDRRDLEFLMQDLERLASRDWQRTADLWEKYRPGDIDKPHFIDGDDVAEQRPESPTTVTSKGADWAGDSGQDEFITPELLRKRYLIAADGKYHFRDAEQEVAFEDRGKRLATSRDDPEVARSMVELASAKKWTSIKIKGSDAFKREVWLRAALKGMEVQGFQPAEVDLARLADLQKEAKPVDRTNAQNTIDQSPARNKTVPDHGDVGEGRVELSKQEQAALDALKAILKGRGDRPATIALAESIVAERFATNRAHVGKLEEHGPDNFGYDKENQKSYYAKVRSPDGQTKVLWGVDLERAIAASRAQVGEDIAIAYQGSKEIPVTSREKNEAGEWVATQVLARRGTWDVRRIDEVRDEVKERLAEARESRPQPVLKVYDSAAERTDVRPEVAIDEKRRDKTRSRG